MIKTVTLSALVCAAALGLYAAAAYHATSAPTLPSPPPIDPADLPAGYVMQEETFVDGETDEEDSPLVFDSSRYEFGHDGISHGSLGGDQTFGTMDKAGTHKDVNAAYGGVAEDLDVIAADKVARELFVEFDHQTPIPADNHWNIKIWSVDNVSDTLVYDVYASVGKDPTFDQSSGSDGSTFTVNERWERIVGQDPVLISRVPYN